MTWSFYIIYVYLSFNPNIIESKLTKNTSYWTFKTRLLGRFAPIYHFHCKHVLFVYIEKKKKFADFQNYQKSNFDGGKFLKIRSSINFPWGHVMSHKKFGPDRFSRFDVYWIQTNIDTDKLNLYRRQIWVFACLYNEFDITLKDPISL